jgi:hypothetical protein
MHRRDEVDEREPATTTTDWVRTKRPWTAPAAAARRTTTTARARWTAWPSRTLHDHLLWQLHLSPCRRATAASAPR